MDGSTQIVVQVRYEGDAVPAMILVIATWEDAIEQACGDLCLVDGHDLGSGTANVFLYAPDEDVDRAVARVADLVHAGRLPKEVRIGVAEYLDPERTEWKFRPAFPPGLGFFDIV